MLSRVQRAMRARRCPSLPRIDILRLVWVMLVAVGVAGCGTTRKRLATDQLLTSDAVDRTVASIDFSPLSAQKVYLDTQYIHAVKGIGFVNGEYVISSLRNQMVAAGCLLQDKKEDADYVVEARIGTLGNDEHQVSYGIPASNLLSTASALMPNTPPIPTIPEISFAKKDKNYAAAKVAVFAYDRKSRRPVWQSGIARAESDAQDFWLLGAGPFQSGSVRKRARFAGDRLLPRLWGGDEAHKQRSVISLEEEHVFAQPPRPKSGPHPVEAAVFMKPIPADKQPEKPAGDKQQESPQPRSVSTKHTK